MVSSWDRKRDFRASSLATSSSSETPPPPYSFLDEPSPEPCQKKGRRPQWTTWQMAASQAPEADRSMDEVGDLEERRDTFLASMERMRDLRQSGNQANASQPGDVTCAPTSFTEIETVNTTEQAEHEETRFMSPSWGVGGENRLTLHRGGLASFKNLETPSGEQDNAEEIEDCIIVDPQSLPPRDHNGNRLKTKKKKTGARSVPAPTARRLRIMQMTAKAKSGK
ncbi:hypothetical protein V865_005625 [Kwoniella europaea PYCC6329]|uniref:Uncharacterized protein n=1 Tax=Kwoniella europaea PYCC6329 TaxID=1423913 RepID=A0AAX4KNG3_9TREE